LHGFGGCIPSGDKAASLENPFCSMPQSLPSHTILLYSLVTQDSSASYLFGQQGHSFAHFTAFALFAGFSAHSKDFSE